MSTPKNFKNCFYKTKIINNLAFLELYHGNTYAFKDMALSALPYFMDIAKKNHEWHEGTAGIQEGDLIITNGDGHVSMYTGKGEIQNGKLVEIFHHQKDLLLKF